MTDEGAVKMARFGLWQAVLVVLIAGVCGVAGSYFQFVAKKPATSAEIVETFDRRLPVGTIVSSVVHPQQFSELAGDPGGFEAPESVWVPADGRLVPGSTYASYVGGPVPDLRGVFLRGLDYSEDRNVLCGRDPDGAVRIAGHYQEDALQDHKHKTTAINNNSVNNSIAGINRRTSARSPATVDEVLDARTADETRPKNVAVYYYIKIN
jgi:hypothetical protein